MVYNLVYVDAKSGRSMIKRFQVLSVTRDREYDLTKGAKGSKILYFTANPNGEAEVITVYLTASSSARKKVFDFDFAELEIKGRGAGGNILTKYPVRKIQFKSAGVSTLGGVKIWYDEVVGRLNRDDRGTYLGNFNPEDQIIVFYKDGSYELTSFELTNRYEPNQLLGLSKFKPELPVNAVHYDGDNKVFYVKRFLVETTTSNKRFGFISEAKGSKLLYAANSKGTKVEVIYKDGRSKEKEELDLQEVIDVKGWKAIGNKCPIQNIQEVKAIEEEPAEEELKAGQDVDLDSLKESIKNEVEDEDNQMDLFGGGKKED